MQKRDIRNFVLPRRTTDPLSRETMTDNSSRADGARVLTDLHALRAIGPYKTGVHKPTFSEPHLRSLAWLVQRIPEAGLAGEIDGIGPTDGSPCKLSYEIEHNPTPSGTLRTDPSPCGSRCATMTNVVSGNSARSRDITSFSVSRSSALVASSRNAQSGLASISRTSARRCCSPTERSAAFSFPSVKPVPKPRLAEQAFDGAGRNAVRLGRIGGSGNERRQRHVYLLRHEAQMPARKLDAAFAKGPQTGERLQQGALAKS